MPPRSQHGRKTGESRRLGNGHAKTAAPKARLGVLASLKSFCGDLGPGLITGCADDDPSGISTYSVAGASLGYATLWTAFLSFPEWSKNSCGVAVIL